MFSVLEQKLYKKLYDCIYYVSQKFFFVVVVVAIFASKVYKTFNLAFAKFSFFKQSRNFNKFVGTEPQNI